MKGIILAGGSGTRLSPMTLVLSKQILPVYDKPMIYYSLSTLMLAGIKEILIISNPEFIELYKKLLGDGSSLGIKIQYAIQKTPNGIANAFTIGKAFIGKDAVCLILGDNMFYGAAMQQFLKTASKLTTGAILIGAHVKDYQRYGIAQMKNNKVIAIVEKPSVFISDVAITGLYFYDNDIVRYVTQLKPSARGELEITDINNIYIKHKKCKMQMLPRGYAWFDSGTPDALLDTANYIATIQNRQNNYIGAIEEVAYRMKYISQTQLQNLAKNMKNSEYSKYLLNL